jgi:uncharacterized protein YdhG (YjbR/CyaY superfamily)
LDAIAHSDADDVDAYLALVPEGRRAVLNEMRDACRTLLAGFDESMRYGMPAYSRDGVAEIAWASQKRYISLYVMRTDVLSAHRSQLADLDVGKGCIRYAVPPQSTSPSSGRCLPPSQRARVLSADQPWPSSP